MLNKVILIGKLGFDPEVKYFDNGNIMCVLKLVTSNNYGETNNDKNENNDWHRIILYKNLANFSKKFLNKRDVIFVEGRIKTRKWLTEEKKYNYITEIIADKLKLIKNYNKKEDYKNYKISDSKLKTETFNKNLKKTNNYNSKSDSEIEFLDSLESNNFDKSNKNINKNNKEFLNSDNNEISFNDLESEN